MGRGWMGFAVYAQRFLARHAAAGDAYLRGVDAARAGYPNPALAAYDAATALGWSVTRLTDP